MANTACLVCFVSTVNGCSNKRKEAAYPWKPGTSSRHITNLKQSILETSMQQHSEKQALVAGTKQSKLAKRAVRAA